MTEPQVVMTDAMRRAVTPVLGVLLLLAVGVLTFSTIPGVRDQPGFHPTYDGWVQCSGYVLSVLLAATLLPVRGAERTAWLAILAYLVLNAAGFLLFILHVRTLVPQPYPSVADLPWLASRGLLLIGLWLLVRSRLPRLSRTLVLDAAVAALTVAALVVTLLFEPLRAASPNGADASVIATSLAYPVSDIALLALVGALVVTAFRRATPADVALFIGVAAGTVVDALYLFRVANGTFHPGSFLAPLSLGATAVIAASGLLRRQRETDPERAAGLFVPATLAAVCALILALTPTAPLGAHLLASAGILVAIVRGLTTLEVDRAASSRVIAAGEEELVQFKSVVEAGSTFIAIAALDGTVIYVNPAGRRMVGLDPDVDVRTTVIADYLTEEGLKASVEIEQPAVVAHGHWEGESTLRRMDGGPPIPVEIYSFLVKHPETGEPWLLATAQRDITEKLATERALRELAEQRQRLLTDLVAAQENERYRIAADVHDDSVQALAAVELRLLVMQRQLERAAPDLVPQCDELGTTVRRATARLRHLLFDLDSPAQRSDLRTALEEAAEYLFENEVRWRVEGEVDASEPTRVIAYRIAKEAMTNVAKHASARQVVITLGEAEGELRLTVVDDGRGTAEDPTNARPGHFGMAGMRDRATVAGGRLEVESRAGGGTTVSLWLPLRPGEPGIRQDAS